MFFTLIFAACYNGANILRAVNTIMIGVSANMIAVFRHDHVFG